MTEALEDTAAGIRQQALALTFHAAFHQARAAYLSGEWQQLGYESFRDYIDATRGPVQITLDPDQRRELVAELSASGVPQVDQATLIGVSDRTLRRDRTDVRPSDASSQAKGKDQRTDVRPDHEPDIDADPPTPAERKAAERAERQRIQEASDGRNADRVRKFLDGWITVEHLSTNKRRDAILAKLIDSDRALLEDIGRAISWPM